VLKQLFTTTPLEGEGEQVTALAAGPSILLAGGRRGRVAVLDSATGKRLFTSRKVGKRLVHVFVSGDGNALMATDAALSNFVWRREAGKFKYYRHWHRKTGRSQALSRSGRILIREDVRKSVRWYELATRKMKELVKARGVAASGDGRRVAVRNLKGEVEVRDGSTGRRLHLVSGVPKEARMMGLNANGELLVSVTPGTGAWTMEVREVKTGSVRHKVGPVPGKVEGLSVSGTAPVAVARTSAGLAVMVLDTGSLALKVSQRFALATVYGYRMFAVPAGSPAQVQGFEIAGVGGQTGSAGAGAPQRASRPSTTGKNTGN
jgi:hypothetical protein